MNSLSPRDTDDTLNGGAWADVLSGGDHNDLLLGGPSNDSLFEGSGNGTLTGGTGNDHITGGTGADRFVFGPTSNGGANVSDTVLDFTRSQSDKLAFDATAFAPDTTIAQILANTTTTVTLTREGGGSVRIDGGHRPRGREPDVGLIHGKTARHCTEPGHYSMLTRT